MARAETLALVMGAVFFTSVYRSHGDARTAQEESGILPPPPGTEFLRFKMSDSVDGIAKITLPDGTLLYCRKSQLRRAVDSLH